MALYKDGNPVSGLNSIPRLTLAQYNALNVKPEFWVRTDAPESYKKLSADQVSYDSDNTVKDKLDINDFAITCPNATPTGQFKKIGNMAFISAGFDITTASGGGAVDFITFNYIRAKTSSNWVGTKVSGNTLTPSRGYISGNKLYIQNTPLAVGDGLIINAIFETE